MGLKAKDLKHMLDNIFEIDSYASKMGDDKNIVTLSFSLKDSLAAQDLTNFLEKGYEFILDADATPGEQLNNYKEFFNRGYLESVDMLDDILTIKKKYADPISFKFVDFGDKYEITESLTESFNVDSYPEILFLTKYLGDYGISKYGEDLLFENSNKVLKVRRIQ